jgi:hypothetical protein
MVDKRCAKLIRQGSKGIISWVSSETLVGLLQLLLLLYCTCCRSEVLAIGARRWLRIVRDGLRASCRKPSYQLRHAAVEQTARRVQAASCRSSDFPRVPSLKCRKIRVTTYVSALISACRLSSASPSRAVYDVAVGKSAAELQHCRSAGKGM